MKKIMIKKGKIFFFVFLVLLTFSLTYQSMVMGIPNCDRAYLSNCSFPCYEDGIKLVRSSSAGTTTCFPKSYYSVGGSCGQYFYYSGLSGGTPQCETPGSWSSYSYLSSDCNVVNH